MKHNKELRVRFAPSPTGHLHIGNARVAIFNWLFAKHNNGKYLVRIEDTDLQRSKKEFLDEQLNSFKWLSLLSDEPIVYQSTRVEEHRQVIKELLEKKLAYPCFCDPLELEKKRSDCMQLGKTYKYDKSCRNKGYTEQDLNKPHAIRFAIPDDCSFVEFEDIVCGKIKVDADYLDDFIILRRDGNPTYNFVVVIDDIFMQISHIIRGQDHISNTHKQILLYKALGKDLPQFAHVPLILGSSGNKLSKRDTAVSVQEYKKNGFLPDALFNYLVRLGWSHGDQEIFTKEEMIKHFSFDRVGKKGAIFDIKKLEWLNGVYIRNATFEQLIDAVKDLDDNYYQQLVESWSEEQLKELIQTYKQRAVRLLDMVQDIISFFNSPKVLDLTLIDKWRNEKTINLLRDFLEAIEKLDRFNHDDLQKIAQDICNKFDVKLVALAQPLRLALIGKTVSPGVFELMSILKNDGSVGRVRFLLNSLEQAK